MIGTVDANVDVYGLGERESIRGRVSTIPRWVKPACIATRANSTRSSFDPSNRRCHSTVLTLRCRRRAISAVVSPSPMKARTSNSRCVNADSAPRSLYCATTTAQPCTEFDSGSRSIAVKGRHITSTRACIDRICLQRTENSASTHAFDHPDQGKRL